MDQTAPSPLVFRGKTYDTPEALQQAKDTYNAKQRAYRKKKKEEKAGESKKDKKKAGVKKKPKKVKRKGKTGYLFRKKLYRTLKEYRQAEKNFREEQKKKKALDIKVEIGDKLTDPKFKFSKQYLNLTNKSCKDEKYKGVTFHSHGIGQGTDNIADYIDLATGGVVDMIEALPDVITDLIESQDYSPNDLAQVTVVGADDEEYFVSDWETVGSIGETLDVNLQDTSKWYGKFFDSKNQTINYVTKNVFVEVCVVKNPFTGGAGHKALPIQSSKDFKNKRSIVMIENRDDLCLGRCCVIALAKRDNHPKLKQIVAGRKIQTELAEKLYEDAGVEKTISSLDTIRQFEEYLDASITIIDSDCFNDILYPDINDTDYVPKDFNIYVLKTGDHFHYINSNKVAGFFCKDYFCDKCKKTYKDKDKHKCKYKCSCCATSGCFDVFLPKEDKSWINCADCWRSFPSQKCYDNHKRSEEKKSGKNKGEQKLSMCDRVFKCPECKKFYDKSKYRMEEHRCGDTWCKNCDCKINTNDGHKCYMFPKAPNKTDTKYIFFDFECSQDTGTHVVNYCIAQYYDSDEIHEFLTLESFCEWVFQEDHKNYTVIAHNGRGYDFQFIMRYVYKNTCYKPDTIYAGSKIMIMRIPDLKIRFVDSLNFLTMPLASFPKTFGLKELKKGFFPHFFNTPENWDYKGKIPPLRYFGYNSMSPKKRKELIQFWVVKRASNYVWDQYEEMRAYCISDVDILRRCCIKFRELYLDIAGIDPFTYTTIASVCMAIFKSKYITPEYDPSDKDNKDLIRQKVFQDEKIAIIPYDQQKFIRGSFFGGRTNSIKLKYNFTGDEIGVYSDITSLYPTVNYYDEYPIGHPEEITENFGDISQYFGFIECFVIPPKGLYFPVLPRKDGKLLFDLEPKRGTWTTIELNKAIEKGYVVKEVYKVLHYKRRSKTIFREYVSTFLKVKQEASGYPDWCKNDSDRQKYIDDYKKRQGIALDPASIKKNPGLRAIAKLCLNSLWGKFGQRLNMPKNEIITSSQRFNKVMFDDKYTGQAWSMIDSERMEMSYREKEEYIQDDYNTNIAIASFTTSHARLRLYWALERLDRQVLYHDTDSVVYVWDRNNPDHFKIENGDLLGDWTDELEGVDMCGTFLGAGPKNYSYETTDGEFHTKIKGFTLDYKTTTDTDRGRGLNHSSMEDMIDANVSGSDTEFKIPIRYRMITRDKKEKVLHTTPITKNYGFVYEKRERLPPDENGNVDTLPFGFY